MYQFKKINEDEYKLISGDKEFTFTRTVDLAKEMQSVDLLVTIKLADLLAGRGETFDNTKLRIERKEGNQTIVDESNLRMIESKLKEQAYDEIALNLIKKAFNMDVTTLVKELGLKIEETSKFCEDFFKVLAKGIDDTP